MLVKLSKFDDSSKHSSFILNVSLIDWLISCTVCLSAFPFKSSISTFSTTSAIKTISLFGTNITDIANNRSRFLHTVQIQPNRKFIWCHRDLEDIILHITTNRRFSIQDVIQCCTLFANISTYHCSLSYHCSYKLHIRYCQIVKPVCNVNAKSLANCNCEQTY